MEMPRVTALSQLRPLREKRLLSQAELAELAG